MYDHCWREMTHTPSKDGILSEISQPFRPRARLLQLLGDELIGTARLAVFELVKNAYDADAAQARVCLDLRSEQEAAITVTDDGEGMTLDVLKSIWLVPGDDHRQRQRLSEQRTAKYGRLPLGEKGLGRFAVHKLGNYIKLVTRAKDFDECVVEIDWSQLIAQPYLDDAPVTISVRRPEVFLEDRTGTRIEIRQLREAFWSRREVRRLHNQITSICSPFEEPSGFSALLQVPGREGWIEDLPDVSKIIDRAPWRFSFHADRRTFDWTYAFRQIPGLNLSGRRVRQSGDRLLVGPLEGGKKKPEIADPAIFDGIGSVGGEFYVYDREHDTRRRIPNIRLLETYLDETGGIRVYRDGIRVYNYGEHGDDWLGLDLRRVNIPTRRISRNIILGAIHLSVGKSAGLVEKTNREGFVENNACQNLRRIIIGALTVLEAERDIDKDRIRQLTSKPTDPKSRGIAKPIADLKQALERQGIRENFDDQLEALEKHYLQMEEIFLAAGMRGMNVVLVFHEIERGVHALHQMITGGTEIDRTKSQAAELVRVLDGFSLLLRRDSVKHHSASKLVKSALQNSGLRLRHHRIDLSCPILEAAGSDFRADFSFSFGLGALSNLIDNALYWLGIRWPDAGEFGIDAKRKLYIGVSQDFEMGPTVVVADNGPGLRDDPANLVSPFFTRKPNGMGLGLYYANLAMGLNGGALIFPDRSAVNVPTEFDGAIVALVFGEP